jgi:AraC-like DNA-binding protein
LYLFLLVALVLAGGGAGILIFRKRKRANDKPSRSFVMAPERADAFLKKINFMFEVEKVYRQENISIQSLSEELAIPSYQLSWIINNKMNLTFFELVNKFRVEEVKNRLASPQDADKTILEIAFDAGFSTKTSFNRVFKRLARMTPSQYRKQL